MIRVYNNPKYAGERVMLLFTNPTDVERLVEGGVKITSEEQKELREGRR